MSRASYHHGVAWIALNDNAGSTDGVDEVAGYISTCLLADLFSKDPRDVARAILRVRLRENLAYMLKKRGTQS